MSGSINNFGAGVGGEPGLGALTAGKASSIGRGVAGGTGAAGGAGGFADVLKGQIDEVVKLQQDASKAVQDVTLGKTDDVTGVLTAIEKSDVAFKTLLSIRSKLMEAYDEVKNIQL